MINKLILAFFVLCICSCKNGSIDDQFLSLEKSELLSSGIGIEYPGEGTLFPPEFPAPEFLWNDTLNASGRWHIRLSSQSGKELHGQFVESSAWRPDPSVWKNVKEISGTESVYFTVIGEPDGFLAKKYSSGRISFSISKDSVGAPIFFRAVPLPFKYAVEHVNEIEWYSGAADGGKPHKVLDNIPVCANCHSFSSTGLVAMDVDYANDKGSYIIAHAKDTVQLSYDKIITWSDYKRDEVGQTFGLLSHVSPDGNYVLSTVKDRSVFVPVDNLEYSQLFFPIKGIIAVYDRDSKEFYELPGASDPAYVQSNPNWSPDSRELMFTRATRYKSSKIDYSERVLLNPADAEEFTSGRLGFKYDLHRLQFNGGMGGQSIPVPGASGNNKSNFFARYSPDGQWIVFCQADNFMLLQADSKLYIMPATGGEPRLMNCNTGNMNSWHSWSPNGRWLVFSSKARGPYTQLFLTHIDEEGKDSPPVFLENLAFKSKAANIPEFIPPEASELHKMIDAFSGNAIYYRRLAATHALEKRYQDALKLLKDAIHADSTYYDAYELRVILNLTLRNSRSYDDLRYRTMARSLIDKQIRQNPQDGALYIKRGRLRLMNEDYEGALQDGFSALKTNANEYEGYQLLASVYEMGGQADQEISYKKKMLGLKPDDINMTKSLALAYHNNKEPELALDLTNDLIARYPNRADLYVSRGNLMLHRKDYPAAKADFDRAIALEPWNYINYRSRSSYFRETSFPDLAGNDLNQALTLLEEDIRKNPQNAPLILIRAEVLEQMGDVQGALLVYENYLKEWPPVYSALQSVAQVYYSQQQWQKAIDSYSAIIENFTARSQVYMDRSRAYEQSGNMQEALNDLNRAIRIYPEEYICYFARARIKDQMGDQEGYHSDLRTTAELLESLSKTRKLNQKEQNILSSIQEQY